MQRLQRRDELQMKCKNCKYWRTNKTEWREPQDSKYGFCYALDEETDLYVNAEAIAPYMHSGGFCSNENFFCSAFKEKTNE